MEKDHHTSQQDIALQLPFSIPLQTGEVWWGGCVSDGIHMPYTEASDHETQLGVNQRGNQAAPFLVSSAGRFVWSEEPFTFRFRSGLLCLTGSTRPVHLSEGHHHLAGAFKAASARFFPPSGKTPPDLFFAKPQYNTWIELNHNQTQAGVLDYAKNLVAGGFPPGLLMIDAGWDDYWGKLDFHRGRFPDPAAMVRELKSLGFTVLLWVSPFISPDSIEYRSFRNNPGMFLRRADGSPAVLEWWDGHSVHLDLTDPQAIEWFHGRLAFLQAEYGIDGFKFDAGDTSHYQSHPSSILNATPAEITERWARLGLEYSFNEFRACWKMGGAPLVQRLSDRLPDWGSSGLGSLIPNGLAQGLIGHPFICPDMIGGGEYTAFNKQGFQTDEELFVRSAQASALFPMMQFSALPNRVLSPEARGLCLEAVRLHETLVPVILEAALESANTGFPILCPLEWAYPHQGYAGVRDQFLIADKILAAPVMEKGAQSRKVIFPPGVWCAADGGTVTGPCEREIPVSLASIPFWYRQA